MVEKTGDDAARIQRCELVRGARRQALADDLGRGGGAGGYEEGQVGMRLAQMLDQAQDRQAFAHRGGVEPHEVAIGARRGGVALPLGQAVRGNTLAGEVFGDAAIGQPLKQICRHAVEAHGQGRGHVGHQPPVWLMWRDMRPSTV